MRNLSTIEKQEHRNSHLSQITYNPGLQYFATTWCNKNFFTAIKIFFSFFLFFFFALVYLCYSKFFNDVKRPYIILTFNPSSFDEDQNFIKALRPKKELPNFFEPQSFVHKQLSIPTHSPKCYVRQYSLSILYLNHLTLTKWEWNR